MNKKKILSLCKSIVDLLGKNKVSDDEGEVVFDTVTMILKDYPRLIPDDDEIDKLVATFIQKKLVAKESVFNDELLIGELLVLEKLATEEEIEKALKKQYRLRKTNKAILLGQILVDDGIITNEDMNKFIYKYYTRL